MAFCFRPNTAPHKGISSFFTLHHDRALNNGCFIIVHMQKMSSGMNLRRCTSRLIVYCCWSNNYPVVFFVENALHSRAASCWSTLSKYLGLFFQKRSGFFSGRFMRQAIFGLWCRFVFSGQISCRISVGFSASSSHLRSKKTVFGNLQNEEQRLLIFWPRGSLKNEDE